MDKEYESIRRNALPWVRRAGQIARRKFGSAVASRKADRSPVTDADHAVQEALQQEISKRFPADAVVTEETQRDPERHAALASAKRCWIIDPIDGTRNYARALPLYSVSVALVEDGRPVAEKVDPRGRQGKGVGGDAQHGGRLLARSAAAKGMQTATEPRRVPPHAAEKIGVENGYFPRGRRVDERSRSLAAADQIFFFKDLQGAADGDLRRAEPAAQFPFGRHPLPRTPIAGKQAPAERIGNSLVSGHGSRREVLSAKGRSLKMLIIT